MRTIEFHKAGCGVEFLLQVGLGHPLLKATWTRHNTDYLDILLFKKGKGQVVLNQQRLPIVDNTKMVAPANPLVGG